ncbi:MAG TPA: type IV toxin-antitoxin system AbiEi family antitoxin domain-containing protein [Propionibacteriaceae bacterium]|nr:type IV toxin-antitoxin system AbiEi family antitoxin domain-containing protein [Propionibacteriaceae bacterium]
MTSVSLTRDLLRQGYDYAEVSRLVRSGGLHRVRRGAYADAHVRSLEAEAAYLRLIEATVRQTRTPIVVSHMSAAALYGFPVWSDALNRVHLTRNRTSGGSIRRYVHLHASPFEPHHITQVGEYQLTSPARTVVDLARSLPVQRAVPIADAALAAGLSRADIADLASQYRLHPGAGAMRRVVALADGSSESVGESVSRVIFNERGLPTPVLQYTVTGPDGRIVGRADFCWEQERTLGEFDGRIKYGRLLAPGQSVSDVLFEEKRREDALRDLGWQVVRWVWDDLSNPAALVDRLRRAYERGRRTS